MSSATSKVSPRLGRSKASSTSNRASTPRSRAFSRAFAIAVAEMSMPSASAPCAAASSVCSPVPQPTSITRPASSSAANRGCGRPMSQGGVPRYASSRARSVLLARDRGDIRGDVLRVLPGDEIRGHLRRDLRLRLPAAERARAEADLVENDVLDRALLEVLCAVARERVVEVGTDRRGRAGSRERVARSALSRGLEELLAVRHVDVRGRAPARAAAGREQRRSADEDQPGEDAAHHYAGGVLPVVPSAATASSRVGWIVKTRSRPVISKIFVMFRSLQTSESWPSLERRRFTAPTSTPRVVESMNVVPLKSTMTSLRRWPITSSSCCLNSGAV